MNAWTREDYFICSKIPPAFINGKRAGPLIDASVKAVNQGYLDCMLLLWPGSFGAKKLEDSDPQNIQNRHECWKVLEEKVEQKLLKGAGVSNFQTRHLEALMSFSDLKPILNQIECHPLYIDEDTIKFCQDNDIVIEAYAPFAQGN